MMLTYRVLTAVVLTALISRSSGKKDSRRVHFSFDSLKPHIFFDSLSNLLDFRIYDCERHSSVAPQRYERKPTYALQRGTLEAHSLTEASMVIALVLQA